MGVGWARLFSMLEFEVRGKWEEAGDLWRKAGEAQEGWTEVNMYVVFVAYILCVHHDRPRHSKPDDKNIIKSMEIDDVARNAQSIRIC